MGPMGWIFATPVACNTPNLNYWDLRLVPTASHRQLNGRGEERQAGYYIRLQNVPRNSTRVAHILLKIYYLHEGALRHALLTLEGAQ
jgi:hypothetical protein